MESDFRKAWEVRFAEKRSRMTDQQAAARERFALGNRKRAREFIARCKSALQYEFAGKRVLDVGSAYGGFVIECALLGADAYGIEIEEPLHELALANAQGERGRITLLRGDILDPSLLDVSQLGAFDLVVINDVFEHVYDSVSLFRRIAELTGEGSIVYFSIPNGWSYTSIEQEGHYFHFGLSLLEPANWQAVVGGFNVYYRPLLMYQLLFQEAGFPHLYLYVDQSTAEKSPSEIQQTFQALEKRVHDSPFKQPALNEKLKHRFSILKAQLGRDLETCGALELHLKYGQYFWTGFAVRTTHPNLDQTPGLIRLSRETKESEGRRIADIGRFSCGEPATSSHQVDISGIRLETQDGNPVNGKVDVPPSQARFRFGLQLTDLKSPKKGDFTRAVLSLSVDADRQYVLSLDIDNAYESPCYSGRIEWVLSVDGRPIHVEDISRSSAPRHFCLLVRSSTGHLELDLVLRALMDCEPWNWGLASRTFIDHVVLEELTASVGV
jgi:2-polyprenyl-3-methyl-5-hydroxy-6-metoxy-1,4-benzoquinol methylase